MKVVCSAATPDDMLSYIIKSKERTLAGLYFLDLDLQHELNGIQLAEKIREIDPRGFVVFVTVDAYSHVLTFQYKVEAMDYIVKGRDNLESRICECIKNAHKKFTSKVTTPLQDIFSFKRTGTMKGRIETVGRSQILYFETGKIGVSTRSIIMHTHTNSREFRGTIKELEKQLDERFVKCHRSFIVNMEKVIAFDRAQQRLELEGGKALDVADRLLKKFEAALVKFLHNKVTLIT